MALWQAAQPGTLIWHHLMYLGVLVVLGAPLFFLHAADRGLWSSHEGRAAQHAQLMLDTGQWAMPTLYWGQADYEKPPLDYWLIATVAWLRGRPVDELSTRLPALIAALLGLGVVYGLAASLWRPVIGCLAGAVLASSIHYAWLARVGRIDMPLTLCTTLALTGFWQTYRHRFLVPDPGRRAWPWLAGSYTALALGVLLKGPLPLVLVAVVMTAFLAWEGRPVVPGRPGFGRLARGFGLPWGLPLVLVIAGPWFVWAIWTTHGQFFRVFFIYHNLERGLGGAAALRAKPVWFYLPRLLGDAFPWALLLPLAGVLAARPRAGGRDVGARFALAWLLGIFGFLSLMRFKRHDYLLPAYPAIALLIAAMADRLGHSARSGRAWRWARWNVAVACAALAAGAGVLLSLHAMGVARWFLGLPGVRLYFNAENRFRVDLVRRMMPELRTPAVLIGGALLLAAAWAFWAIRRGRPVSAMAGLALGLAGAIIGYTAGVLPRIEPYCSQRAFARSIRRMAPRPVTVHYYKTQDHDLVFYVGCPARVFVHARDLQRMLGGPEPVFVVMETKWYAAHRRAWAGTPMWIRATNEANPLGRHAMPLVLVSNRPAAGLGSRAPRGVDHRS